MRADSAGTWSATLRKGRWTLALSIVALTGAATLGVVRGAPVYAASVEVIIEPVARPQGLALAEPSIDEVELATQVRIITSAAVVAAAAEQLAGAEDVPLPGLFVAGITGGRVITITAVSRDGVTAADVANALASAYLEHRRESALDHVRGIRDDLDRLLADAGDAGQDSEVDANGSDTGDPPSVDPQDLWSGALPYLRTLRTVVADPEAFVGAGGAVLRPAVAPVVAASPQPVTDIGLGSLAGLVLGLGIIFLRSEMQDRVLDETDLRRLSAGRPVLATMPVDRAGSRRPLESGMVTPVTPLMQAASSLRANLHLLGSDGTQVIMVTSAQPGEGKTVAAVHLALAAVEAGHRTVLIDADLRRPGVARLVHVEAAPGLSDVLLGSLRVLDALQGAGGVHVLTEGTPVADPFELFTGDGMPTILADLRPRYDLIIVDTAPVLAVADTLELSIHADAVVLVTRADRTAARHVTEAIQALDRAHAMTLGTVLNRGTVQVTVREQPAKVTASTQPPR